ncbi:MAG: hypothetical protein HY699_09740 [Deltaproteobacteria bacterium]|nr:hypothetical protein [Deltaproteobacteria bacterium]
MTDKPDLILALDAGGSSTRCLLVRRDGSVLGRGCGGPGNHILSGWEAARAAVADAIAEACRAAQVEAAAVGLAMAGSAGVGPDGMGSQLVEALVQELLPNARVRAIGDMVAAFWGALSTDFGVVVAAGTGSVCWGRNAAGDTRQVGGWGHILGDEGSAYDIAVRALRAGARATDGRGPRTELTQRLVSVLAVSDYINVALRIYGDPLTRDAIARLATTVVEVAARGDQVAQSVLAEAGAELGLHAVIALRVLGLGECAAPVAYTGAVFAAGECILESFRRTIIAACPLATVVRPEFPPVAGALKLALRELGVDFTPAIAATLRATLGAER